MKQLPACAAALLSLCAAACHKDGVLSLSSSATAPSALAFGDVQVTGHKALSLTVGNDSAFAIDLLQIVVDPPFSVLGGPASIPSGASISLQVTFAPSAAGAFDQPLTLRLNADATPTLSVRLTGSGIANGPLCGTCGAGQACCGNACVDTQSDPAHCGGCTPCTAGQTCTAGVCGTATPPPPPPPPPPAGCDDLTNPCPGAQKCCDHACVDVGTSGLCPCTGTGGTTTFGAGSLIIPMDACLQRGKDVLTLPSYCTANAKQKGDDSPLKAYGLVFFLLRHHVTVYMAINPTKTSIDAIDMTLISFSGSGPVQRYDWASGKAVPLVDDEAYKVDYRGAPFLIDSSQHDRVMQLFATDPDFAQFRSAANVVVHVAKEDFKTGIAKSISAVPSRVALLAVPSSRGESPTDILVRYLASAGLDFPGAGGTPASPGQIYDELQESDFLPDYDRSNLKSHGYRLLWSPHWDGGTSNTPAQLASIAGFVGSGGDLFAECAAIGTLEGLDAGILGGGPPGSSATRFMTNKGMAGNTLNFGRNQAFSGPFTLAGLTSPFAQRGDFPFAAFTGAITDFHPDPLVGASYYSDVVRYVTASDQTGRATDVFTSVDLHAQGKGTVVYLAGHDYSYGGRGDGTTPTPGLTAGSRLVLNTLFSLGTNDVCQP